MKLRSFQTAILIMIFGLAACGGPSEQEMTAQALGQSISLTATAGAGEGFDAQAELQAAVAEATAKAVAAEATQAAAAGISAEAAAATATAEAPIRAELPTYGIDPNNGHVGWIHPPAALSVTGYLQYDYVNQFIGTVAQNFVVSVDVTWDTTGGLAGCGLVLRSDGNKDALNQYMVIATRGANGHVLFSSMVNGKIHNTIDNYANGLDPNFNAQNGATNRITIVGRGNTFGIYTNGVQIGQIVAGDAPVLALPPVPVQPPAGASEEQLAAYNIEVADYDAVVADIQGNYNPSLAIIQKETPYFERGFLAMVAVNESGTTTCQFNNAWLWIVDK